MAHTVCHLDSRDAEAQKKNWGCLLQKTLLAGATAEQRIPAHSEYLLTPHFNAHTLVDAWSPRNDRVCAAHPILPPCCPSIQLELDPLFPVVSG